MAKPETKTPPMAAPEFFDIDDKKFWQFKQYTTSETMNVLRLGQQTIF
jgi:hypothetical protein